MSERIPVGVLGVGRMGQVHCSQIAATPGLELVAASGGSPDLLRAVGERYGIATYASHEELLRDPRPRWIVIATTTDRHRQWALEALSAGRELIIEKPVALSLAEAQEIFAGAEKRGLRVTVHNNRRWDRDFEVVLRAMREGLLGQVYRIESRYTDYSRGWANWGAQGAENPWRLKSGSGGGLLNDWGPHLFDQLLVMAGPGVRRLYGKTYRAIWSREVEDHWWAELELDGGVSARVEASNNFRLPEPRWCLVGTEGTLQVAGGDPATWNAVVIRRSFGELDQLTRIDVPREELSVGFYADFADAVAHARPLPVQPGEVLAAARLIDAVRESDRTGEAVHFPARVDATGG